MVIQGIRGDAGMGARDESLHSLPQIHDHSPVLDARDARVRFEALDIARHQPRPGVLVQLLDSERNTLVVGVHVQHHDLDLGALPHHLGGVFDAPGPAHVRNVNQTVYSGFDLHERPEGSEVSDGSCEPRPVGVLQRQREPGILLDLFHAEGDLLVLRVHLEDDGFDFVSDRDELGGVAHVARPRHLGDVDETLHALLQLHERTVVRDRHHVAAHPRANGIPILDVRPRVRQQLLQT